MLKTLLENESVSSFCLVGASWSIVVAHPVSLSLVYFLLDLLPTVGHSVSASTPVSFGCSFDVGLCGVSDCLIVWLQPFGCRFLSRSPGY